MSPYKKLGDGDIIKGFREMNKMRYWDAKKLVDHPIACIDCHDPETMQLRITGPGFIEGMKAYKASQGVKDYDVNKQATHQEMRSFVCGQCHVEYYFQGRRSSSPTRGTRASRSRTSWPTTTRSSSRTGSMPRPARPRSRRSIRSSSCGTRGSMRGRACACADCHMPYMRVGAQKISDHHVRSPLLNINHACQPCHKLPEEELKARAEQIQDRTHTHARHRHGRSD